MCRKILTYKETLVYKQGRHVQPLDKMLNRQQNPPLRLGKYHILEYLWIFMDIHGYLWIFMDILEYFIQVV